MAETVHVALQWPIGCLVQVHREFQQPEEYGQLFVDIGLLPAAECERLQKQRASVTQKPSPANATAAQAKPKSHAWQMPWYLAEKLRLDTPALLQALGQGVHTYACNDAHPHGI